MMVLLFDDVFFSTTVRQSSSAYSMCPSPPQLAIVAMAGCVRPS